VVVTATSERRSVIEKEFGTRFGRAPSHWVRAPGRVDAMGSHTDYNDGFVLTVAIDRDTWMAAAPRDDGRVTLQSLNLAGGGSFHVDDVLHRPCAGWALSVQAVASLLVDAGVGLRGCDVLVHGTLPIASGLSSSASLEAATAVLFASLADREVDALAMAKLCQRAENEIVGVGCGILDQYSSLLGRADCALLLDCRDLSHTVVGMPEGIQPVVCNTMARRELTGSEYGERRRSCEAGARMVSTHLPHVEALRDVELAQFTVYEAELPAETARRCRFVIEENQRVLAMVDAFREGDREAIARLCEASFAGARDLFGIVIPEMEALYAAMLASAGIVGARQAGAGFGGCMLALVEQGEVDGFVAATSAHYERSTGRRPDIYPVSAVDGAGPLLFD
jgi:galactokinase